MFTADLADKSYGLDEIFRRVQAENVLLEHDFYRMKSILEQAFANHEVDSSQKIYLQRKYKTIKRQNPNSFTELYVNNLLHLISHIFTKNELMHHMFNDHFIQIFTLGDTVTA